MDFQSFASTQKGIPYACLSSHCHHLEKNSNKPKYFCHFTHFTSNQLNIHRHHLTTAPMVHLPRAPQYHSLAPAVEEKRLPHPLRLRSKGAASVKVYRQSPSSPSHSSLCLRRRIWRHPPPIDEDEAPSTTVPRATALTATAFEEAD